MTMAMAGTGVVVHASPAASLPPSLSLSRPALTHALPRSLTQPSPARRPSCFDGSIASRIPPRHRRRLYRCLARRSRIAPPPPNVRVEAPGAPLAAHLLVARCCALGRPPQAPSALLTTTSRPHHAHALHLPPTTLQPSLPRKPKQPATVSKPSRTCAFLSCPCTWTAAPTHPGINDTAGIARSASLVTRFTSGSPAPRLPLDCAHHASLSALSPP